jgi:hypothetical protein
MFNYSLIMAINWREGIICQLLLQEKWSWLKISMFSTNYLVTKRRKTQDMKQNSLQLRYAIYNSSTSSVALQFLKNIGRLTYLFMWGFVTRNVLRGGVVSTTPNPKPGGPMDYT